MKIAVNRKKEGTIKLTITVPWKKVKELYDKLFEKAIKEVEVEGFRKGKAPKELAQDKVEKEKVFQEVIREIVPKFYLKAIKKEGLKPIVSPQVKLLNAKEGKSWQFRATICEKPEVKLGDYKKAIKSLKGGKGDDIWTPGKDNEKKEKKKKATLDQIINALLKEVKVEIPSVLLEDQINRNLSSLLDQLQKLGLSVEQYAKTKGKTVEDLKEEKKEEAKKTLILEFTLQEIADKEEIEVKDKEIEKTIQKEKDEKVRKQLESQKYYLASLLRRQKALDFLLNL